MVYVPSGLTVTVRTTPVSTWRATTCAPGGAVPCSVEVEDCADAGLAIVIAAAIAIAEMPDVSWRFFEVLITRVPSSRSGNVTGYTYTSAIWLFGWDETLSPSASQSPRSEVSGGFPPSCGFQVTKNLTVTLRKNAYRGRGLRSPRRVCARYGAPQARSSNRRSTLSKVKIGMARSSSCERNSARACNQGAQSKLAIA